jgi:hypothetical protein
MAQDWPSPHHHEPHPLPRIEDLPVAWEGYDRERVQAAFDEFYRHIAQLDGTLRTLESVDVFRQQAGDLRAELRSMRAAGWAPYPRGYTLAPERSLFGSVPDAVPRIALEVVFLIVVAAVVAVAKFSSLEIVAVMAGAVVITFLVELIAARERRSMTPIPAAPSLAPAPAVEEPEPLPAEIAREEPAPVVAAAEEALTAGETPVAADTEEPVPTDELALAAVQPEADSAPADDGEGWAAFAEPAGPQPLTLMGALDVDEPPIGPEEQMLAVAEEPAVKEVEQPEERLAEAEAVPKAAEDEEPAPEPEPQRDSEPVAEHEPEPEMDVEPVADVTEAETGTIPRRHRLRRRTREEPPYELPPPPKHVRVLPPPETAVAEAELPPWERGFDETDERRP